MRIVSVVATGLLCWSLSLASAWADDAPVPVLQGITLKNETRVFYGQCSKFGQDSKKANNYNFLSSDLGVSIGLGIVNSLVDISVAALKASVAESSSNSISPFPANSWMYQISADDTNTVLTGQLVSYCVQIVRGEFAVDDRNGIADSCPAKANTALVGAIDQLRSNNVALTLVCPKFFFEALLEQPSNDTLNDTPQKNLLVFRPVALYESEYLDSSWKDAFGGQRNLAITLTLSRAGTDTTLASVLMPFRQIQSSTEKPFFVGPGYFDGMTSKPFVIPALEGDEKAKLDGITAEWPQYLKAKQLVSGGTAPWMVPARTVPERYEKARLALCQQFDAAKIKDAVVPTECKELPKALADGQLLLAYEKTQGGAAATAQEAVLTAQHTLQDVGSAKQAWPHLDCSKPAAQVTCAANLTALYATVSATVLETREQSSFDRFLTQVATNVQTSLDTAITNQAPDKKAAALETKKDAEANFESAKLDVEAAQADLNTATAGGDASKIIDAKKTLISKKAAANKLARQVGQQEYPIP